MAFFLLLQVQGLYRIKKASLIYFLKTKNALVLKCVLFYLIATGNPPFNFKCDHDGIRTHTPLRAPPPQDGKSTNFSTWPKKKSSAYGGRLAVTWLGLEPRTPSLKVMCSTNWATKSKLEKSGKFVTWLGLEPRTPSLKVMCSTNWATKSNFFSLTRVQI